MRSKGGLIALLAVAGLMLGGSVWYTFFRVESPVVDNFLLIDVESGELFRVSGGRGVLTPALNPETGRATLLRISKDEQGAWHVPGRRLSALGDMTSKGVRVTAVDPEDGRVLVEIKDIRQYDPPGGGG